MGSIGNGAKAGAVGGTLYGAISSIFVIITLIEFKTRVMEQLTKSLQSYPSGLTPPSPQTLYNIALYAAPITEIIAGLIVGVILGLVFAYVYDRLPGSGAKARGIIFGLILWVFLGLLLNITNISSYGIIYFAITAGGSFVASIASGYVMGALYERWQEAEKPPENEPAYPQV